MAIEFEDDDCRPDGENKGGDRLCGSKVAFYVAVVKSMPALPCGSVYVSRDVGTGEWAVIRPRNASRQMRPSLISTSRQWLLVGRGDDAEEISAAKRAPPPSFHCTHSEKRKNTDSSDSAAVTKSSHHARLVRKDNDEGLDMATMSE
jgi:hypothetical protein